MASPTLAKVKMPYKKPSTSNTCNTIAMQSSSCNDSDYEKIEKIPQTGKKREIRDDEYVHSPCGREAIDVP